MSARTRQAATEAVLEVWRELLGVDTIGVEDTFTDLGGTSLQIVELRDRLEQRFGLRLTVADLATAATVAELAERLERQGRRAFTGRAPVTTRIGRDSTNATTTVFCLPGSGGSPWSFVPLAGRLPDGIVLEVICQRGLEHRGPAHYRMRSLVRYAVRAIRSVQPRGPYLLLGHSMGGVAALEIAERLRRDGEDIALVVLLDAPLPLATARMLGEPTRAPGGAVTARSGSLPHRIDLYAAMLTAGLVRRPLGRQQELFYEIGLRVQNRHRLRPRPCPVLAVVTDQTAHHVPGWRRVLGDIAVMPVDGGHMDVVRDGPVSWRLAERIGAEILRRRG
ncbi:alpha/beta fold hydrolase [Nocardia sp. NBC_01377]|uniref:thioesterase II family protein n=1 Tax=Nocardia sp. NBC_01377 TaxID=2903595 RepID=UPI0032492D91